MDINLKISELISKNKVAKKTVAKELGIARNTLDDYINGNTSITIEKLEKLSKVLDVPMSYWFEDSGGINNNRMDKSMIANGNHITQSVNEAKCHKELDEARKKIIDLQDEIIRMQKEKGK